MSNKGLPKGKHPNTVLQLVPLFPVLAVLSPEALRHPPTRSLTPPGQGLLRSPARPQQEEAGAAPPGPRRKGPETAASAQGCENRLRVKEGKNTN